MLGSFAGLVVTIGFYLVRRVLPFKECMSCITDGFKAMVPAITILALAWTLKGMTSLLAFATGTSWGTFGILIPICLKIFPIESGNPLAVICVSACMAGAVCGDHCSPISDTTIMSSAGAQCDHMNHVSTQLPYALSSAVISFITYIVAGFVGDATISLLVGVMLMVAYIIAVKYIVDNKKEAA